jgi:hypothetical protein
VYTRKHAAASISRSLKSRHHGHHSQLASPRVVAVTGPAISAVDPNSDLDLTSWTAESLSSLIKAAGKRAAPVRPRRRTTRPLRPRGSAPNLGPPQRSAGRITASSTTRATSLPGRGDPSPPPRTPKALFPAHEFGGRLDCKQSVSLGDLIKGLFIA